MSSGENRSLQFAQMDEEINRKILYISRNYSLLKHTLQKQNQRKADLFNVLQRLEQSFKHIEPTRGYRCWSQETYYNQTLYEISDEKTCDEMSDYYAYQYDLTLNYGIEDEQRLTFEVVNVHPTNFTVTLKDKNTRLIDGRNPTYIASLHCYETWAVKGYHCCEIQPYQIHNLKRGDKCTAILRFVPFRFKREGLDVDVNKWQGFSCEKLFNEPLVIDWKKHSCNEKQRYESRKNDKDWYYYRKERPISGISTQYNEMHAKPPQSRYTCCNCKMECLHCDGAGSAKKWYCRLCLKWPTGLEDANSNTHFVDIWE
eukprot:370493_1